MKQKPSQSWDPGIRACLCSSSPPTPSARPGPPLQAGGLGRGAWTTGFPPETLRESNGSRYSHLLQHRGRRKAAPLSRLYGVLQEPLAPPRPPWSRFSGGSALAAASTRLRVLPGLVPAQPTWPRPCRTSPPATHNPPPPHFRSPSTVLPAGPLSHWPAGGFLGFRRAEGAAAAAVAAVPRFGLAFPAASLWCRRRHVAPPGTPKQNSSPSAWAWPPGGDPQAHQPRWVSSYLLDSAGLCAKL